jgi:protein ImuB
VDTHRPGAFAVSTFAPGPLPRGRQEEALPAPRVALRAFRPPRLAHVVLKGGAPAFVSASGVRGAVAACAGPWRASGDWWDVAFSREEWDVALAPRPGQPPALQPGQPFRGALYRIFLDRLREEWFVEGELD